MTEAQKKLPILNLYLDDSGTRHPSKKQGKKAAHGYDWFALGGVLVRGEDEDKARHLHAAFVEKWGVITPLHSSEIRSQNEGFLWLRDKTKVCAACAPLIFGLRSAVLLLERRSMSSPGSPGRGHCEAIAGWA